eukprot:3211226-Pleurochrysis_carterae.AAC.1
MPAPDGRSRQIPSDRQFQCTRQMKACVVQVGLYLVQLPGLGKTGGTVESPPLTLALPPAHRRQSGHRRTLLVPRARR